MKEEIESYKYKILLDFYIPIYHMTADNETLVCVRISVDLRWRNE